MKGYVGDIEKETEENQNFRKVIYTAKNSQLVLMSLRPGEEIGAEVHHLDQFIRVEKGRGKAILDGVPYDLKSGYAILVPAGAKHNIVNTSASEEMKLYTLYAPPNHRDHVIHKTKAQAEADNEHFDGKLSE